MSENGKNYVNWIALPLALVALGVGIYANVSISRIEVPTGEVSPSGSVDLADVSMEDFNQIIMDWQQWTADNQAEIQAQADKAIIDQVVADNYGIGEGTPVLGDPNAPVKIVEYSEYLCGYCQRHHLETFPQLQKYIDDGTVAYYARHFIIHGEEAQTLAEMATCAQSLGGDTAFFSAHDYLFENFGNTVDPTALATAAGVDANALQACVANDQAKAKVDADTLSAQTYGLTGTPGFFVNGRPIRGAYPFEEFENKITEALAE